MRRSVVLSLLLVGLVSTACSSSGGITSVFSGIPSNETTSSVKPNQSANANLPVPPAAVGNAPANRVTQQLQAQAQPNENSDQQAELLAWGGPVPHTPTERPQLSPSEPPVAMITPQGRAMHVAPATGGQANLGRAARSRIYRANFADAKPINFGKVQPKHYEVHGVDVSRWQTNMDWEKVRSRGGNFAFIKATDGGDHLDPMFKTN